MRAWVISLVPSGIMRECVRQAHHPWQCSICGPSQMHAAVHSVRLGEHLHTPNTCSSCALRHVSAPPPFLTWAVGDDCQTQEASEGDVCACIQGHSEGLGHRHLSLLLAVLGHIHVGVCRAQQGGGGLRGHTRGGGGGQQQSGKWGRWGCEGTPGQHHTE